jgi:adenylate cyclase
VAADIVAGAYARVGARDKAFEWLDKAYEERDGADLALLKVDPAWNNIRSDPRFADLLQRLGLPK